MTDLFPAPSANHNGHGTLAVTPSSEDAARPPASVRIAVWCMYAIVALMLLSIVGAIWDLATWGAYVDRVAPGLHATANQVAEEKGDNMTGDIVGAVLFGLMAVLYVFAAVFARRRSRSGQILAFVGVAPMLLCGAGAFIPVSTTALERAAGDQQPSAMLILGAFSNLPIIPLTLVVAVLLLTGSARTYFRRMPPPPPGYMYIPAASWQPGAFPPAASPWAYPVYPGLPPAQPFVYPPSGAAPPSGFPPLPPGFPAPPTHPGDSTRADGSASTDEPQDSSE